MAVLCNLSCISSIAQQTRIVIYPNKPTRLYGSRASQLQGEVAKKNGDFMSITGAAELTWKIHVSSSGLYQVKICYGAKAGDAVNKIEISSYPKTISLPVRSTTGVWGDGSFEEILIENTLSLKKGSQEIIMKAPPFQEPIEFRNIELIPLKAKSSIDADRIRAHNARAKSDWLAKAGYGLMFHWTSQSVDHEGKKKPYKEAVEEFDLNTFVNMVEETGARYVLFTVGHAEPYCPAPIKAWEKYHPDHTTKRDLIMEMANMLNDKKIKLMCYFPTHVIGKYPKVSEQEFTRINKDILKEFGQRYGDKVAGYWFDGWYQCFEEYPAVSFEDFFKACKEGNPDRIIALNSWIYPGVTEWQEYWAGEAASPVLPPVKGTVERGPGKGLRYQALIIMEPYWVQEKMEMPHPRFNDEELSNYIRKCNEEGGSVTINLGIYQNGKIGDKALAVMKKVKSRLRQ